MFRQTPRGIRLKHVVLKHERACVGPVIRDLALVMVTHHVGSRGGVANDTVPRQTALPRVLRLCDEAIHFAVVNRRNAGFFTMRSAAVGILRIVIRLDACSASGVGIAYGWYSILRGESLRTGIGPEIAVERAILLHDDDHVFDFVNAGFL